MTDTSGSGGRFEVYEGAEFRKAVPAESRIEKLAGGFGFLEGPVWTNQEGGFLVFSDIPRTALVDDFDMPNGLCFSPDERLLYIADSGKPRHIRVFDVRDDSTLSSGRVFCTIDVGVPDGFRCDVDGRVWTSAGDGVQVFAPN